ncbi:unnamed protein product [marine sediment metagenome]|uniref:Uncharacterized protein n=1 Tax=marine sediment metagenome TaxID=412755 RepID=X1D6A4_9ZZZZ
MVIVPSESKRQNAGINPTIIKVLISKKLLFIFNLNSKETLRPIQNPTITNVNSLIKFNNPTGNATVLKRFKILL